MTPASFALEGYFNDVHPYMDYLLMLTEEYELVVVDFAAWTARYTDTLHSNHQFARAALFSNAQLSGITNPPQQQQKWNLGALPEDLIVFRAQLGITSCSDWLVYNRTLYCATSSGVIMIPLVINGHFDGIRETQEIIESRTFQVKAKLGLIAAACGLDGLAARGAYVWESQELPHIALTRIENLPTDRVTWMDENVMSISANSASLIFNSLVRANYGTIAETRAEQRAIGEFAIKRRSTEDIFTQTPEFRTAFTSNSRLYAWMDATVQVAAFEDSSPEKMLDFIQEFSLPVARIYEGASFLRGLVFDTDQGTYFANASSLRAELLSEGENTIVRTFPQSRRYTRQVWSVKDGYVDVNIV